MFGDCNIIFKIDTEEIQSKKKTRKIVLKLNLLHQRVRTKGKKKLRRNNYNQVFVLL